MFVRYFNIILEINILKSVKKYFATKKYIYNDIGIFIIFALSRLDRVIRKEIIKFIFFGFTTNIYVIMIIIIVIYI